MYYSLERALAKWESSLTKTNLSQSVISSSIRGRLLPPASEILFIPLYCADHGSITDIAYSTEVCGCVFVLTLGEFTNFIKQI